GVSSHGDRRAFCKDHFSRGTAGRRKGATSSRGAEAVRFTGAIQGEVAESLRTGGSDDRGGYAGTQRQDRDDAGAAARDYRRSAEGPGSFLVGVAVILHSRNFLAATAARSENK